MAQVYFHGNFQEKQFWKTMTVKSKGYLEIYPVRGLKGSWNRNKIELSVCSIRRKYAKKTLLWTN